MDLNLSNTFLCINTYSIYSLEASSLYTYSKYTLIGLFDVFRKI